MKCLAANECSEWLRVRSIIESPYKLDPPPETHCFQFEPPMTPNRLTAFTRALFGTLGDFSGALVVFTDWALYQPDEMALMDSLRRGHGERRRMLDAPGHLFGPHEEAETIGYCYLTVTFCWSAYLYLASGNATLHFWEGDLIDFWSPEKRVTETVREVVRSYELRVTSDPFE